MPIDYLKVTSEEAYVVLDRVVVDGFKLRDKLIQENGTVGANPDPELIKAWQQSYRNWYKMTTRELLRIYQSERQSLTFVHESALEMYVPGRHAECQDLITKIDVRLKLLQENLRMLTNAFTITFTAGGDNNVQLGGSGNNQEIKQ